jgi:hypothetical protein
MAAQPIDRAAQKNTDYKNAAVQNAGVAPFFMANLGQFSGVVGRPTCRIPMRWHKNKIQIRYCVLSAVMT